MTRDGRGASGLPAVMAAGPRHLGVTHRDGFEPGTHLVGPDVAADYVGLPGRPAALAELGTSTGLSREVFESKNGKPT